MADHKHGEMDIRVQESTFAGFVKFSAWFCVATAIFLILLAMINA